MTLFDPITLGWLYYLSEWVIRLIMVVVVPFRRSPEAAKGWLLLIFFFPWAGLLLYALIGRPYLPRWRREQLARLPRALAPVLGRLRKDPNVFQPSVGRQLNPAATLAERLGHLPILGGNDAELLDDYDGALGRLVADIDAAGEHVHLLYYIFADDPATAPVSDALLRAAARGVRCRVLMDALGSARGLRTLAPRLREGGVEVHATHTVGFFRRKSGRTDLRNHRKIAVIDGRIAYTGSQNLVDAGFKPGITYEELVVRVTGPLALELQYVFVSDWLLETDRLLETPDIFPSPEVTGDVPGQTLPSGPDYPIQNNQRMFVELIYTARHRVVLTTPYFIPDEPLLQALQTAVLRGVTVHLIVSQQQDQFLVCQGQRSYYEELLEAGVHIHQYHARFLHAKHLSVDDTVCVIGSSNLDIRSFQLNSEITVLLYDEGVTRRLRAIQDRYLESCHEIGGDEWRRCPFTSRVISNLARLVSPLL